MTWKGAKLTVAVAFVVLLLLTFAREAGTIKSFFYFEVSRLIPDPLAKYLKDYDLKGELKENCFFIFYPEDGGPTRNIQNSGPSDRSGQILLTLTSIMGARPHYAFVGIDNNPSYQAGEYRFVVDPDGRVFILEPKGFDEKRDYFICPN